MKARRVRWHRYPICPRCFREHACWNRDAAKPMKRPHPERVALLNRGIRIGNRTLLAASCLGCGKLLPGNAFGRHARRRLDIRAYLDLRCPNCKWGAKVKA